MTELKALIGYFDLDPNRVVQIVHLAYAAQADNAVFQRLLVPGALFSADAVPALTPTATRTLSLTQLCLTPKPFPSSSTPAADLLSHAADHTGTLVSRRLPDFRLLMGLDAAMTVWCAP